MIYDFRIWSRSQFRVIGQIYKRDCRIFKKRNGLYRLKNSKGILIDDIPFDDMRVDGVPINSILEVEAVISNISCICGDDPDPPDIPRIFNMTFNMTFN